MFSSRSSKCNHSSLRKHFSKRKNLINIQDEIKRLWIEKKITPVIIIDEANYLPSSILNDLKIILNFDMDSKEPYILLLVGQNPIRNSLNMKANEALKLSPPDNVLTGRVLHV